MSQAEELTRLIRCKFNKVPNIGVASFLCFRIDNDLSSDQLKSECNHSVRHELLSILTFVSHQRLFFRLSAVVHLKPFYSCKICGNVNSECVVLLSGID